MTTPTLEDRLRAHYWSTADRLEVPPLELDDLLAGGTVSYLRTRPVPHRRAWLVAAAAAVVLVVGGAVVMTRHDPGAVSQGPAVIPDGPPDVPHLVPGWVPSGLTLRGGNDYAVKDPPMSRTAIYRDPSVPIGGRTLAVTTNPSVEGWSGAPATVNGRSAIDDSRNGVARLAFTDPSRVGVFVQGRGFSIQELSVIVAGVSARSADPAAGAEVGPLPAGLTLVSDEVAAGPARSTSLTYAADDDRAVDVNVWTVGRDGLEQYAVAADPSLTPKRIRGKDGYVATTPNGDTTIVWPESPGVLIEVRGAGVSADEVERLATSLRPITEDKWHEVLLEVGAAPLTGQSPAPPTTIAGVSRLQPCVEQPNAATPTTAVLLCPPG